MKSNTLYIVEYYSLNAIMTIITVITLSVIFYLIIIIICMFIISIIIILITVFIIIMIMIVREIHYYHYYYHCYGPQVLPLKDVHSKMKHRILLTVPPREEDTDFPVTITIAQAGKVGVSISVAFVIRYTGMYKIYLIREL